VPSVREAEAFIAHVTSDPKCSKASHNVSAYRVAREGTRGPGLGRAGSDHSEGTADLAFAADHDDDGEHGAGRGLSHLLHVTDARNVCVVVSRWFGGIHLGPDRFKHINNAARILLEDAGVIEPRGATKEKQQRGGAGGRAASHRAR
jgi:putative IMPACT (imprinted ancient) family translation regulator